VKPGEGPNLGSSFIEPKELPFHHPSVHLKMVNHHIPQGLSETQFETLSKTVRQHIQTLELGDDIVIQGSRASFTAKPTSDIDIGIRVSAEKFDAFLKTRFINTNPGSAKERTMRHAITTGKIQCGEAGLRRLRRELEKMLGMEVDISVIKHGGPFDSTPIISLWH
jgi:predicted nucleotidyltransferase